MTQPPNFDKVPSETGQPANWTGQPAPGQPAPWTGQPAPWTGQPATGPIGKTRSTGLAIFLFIITIGIYGYFWWGFTQSELKRHSGEGIGGPLAVIIGIIIAPVMAFVTCNEVQHLYERRGQEPPVRTTTGLWY